MVEFNVISKGKYKYPQPEGFVTVDSYILIREGGKRFLLLKFVNGRDERVNGLTVLLTQLDGTGKKIATRKVNFERVVGKPSAKFVAEDKIELYDDCADFRVQVLSAAYDNYLYEQKENEVVTSFIERQDNAVDVAAFKHKLGGKTSVVKTRKAKVPILICALALITAIAVVIATFIQLGIFKSSQDKFLKSGIEYEFADGNSEGDGDIYVTGYTGRAKTVVIPDKIENHSVTKISSGAFKGDKYITSLQINGNVKIEDDAFSGCDNLEKVDFANVTYIGARAFYACGKLTEVNATNLEVIEGSAFGDCSGLSKVTISNSEKTLTLGTGAFENCAALRTVNIDQTVVYPKNYSIFQGSDYITDLSLKNYTADDVPLAMLYGYSGAVQNSAIALSTLYVENMDTIPNYFCSGLNVSSVTISNLVNKTLSIKAFYNCTNLTALNLSEPVECVEAYALCATSLPEIDLSKANIIEEYAFENNKSLSDVKLKDNTTLSYIGKSAFQGCSALGNIFIPSTVETIGENAFAYCTSLIGIEYAQGCALTAIADDTFLSCTSLGDIKLPDSVTAIGTGAFENCTGFSVITVPDSVTSLGMRAFAGCSGMTAITIPATVSSMGQGLLRKCTSLSALTLPYMGGDAGDDTTAYLGYLFGGTDKMSGWSVIPDTLKKVTVTNAANIADYAFYNCGNIESVELLAARQIGAYVFVNCTSLTEIELANTLESIGDHAFGYCTALTEFTLPESVTSVGVGILNNCNALKELTLANLINDRLPYLFSWNGNSNETATVPSTLKTVTITGAQSIPSYAFYNCADIENIQLSDEVATIGNYAFQYCTSLKEITLPSKLKTIGNYAFKHCRLLSKITLPSTLTGIGDGAFEDCYNLYVVYNNSQLNVQVGYGDYGYVAGNALAVYGYGENATYAQYDDYKFLQVGDEWYLVSYPAATATLDLPQRFTYNHMRVVEYALPANIFRENYYITEVNIPANISDIGTYAFTDAYNLQYLTISKSSSFTEIKYGTFRNCTALQSLEIPSSVQTISTDAFFNCLALRSINIPDGMTSIASNAFYNCYRLYEVTNYSSLNITCGSEDNGRVAEYALAVYELGDNDRVDFFTYGGLNCAYYDGIVTIIGADSGVTEIDIGKISYSKRFDECNIAPYAFGNNYTIQTITIGEDIENIGERAFMYCTSLEAINFTGNVNNIGEYSFYNCTGLESVTFATSNGGEIARDAFYYCLNLRQITLPDGLQTIGVSAFEECSSLENVDFGEGLITIGADAFFDCSNLILVDLPATVTTIGDYAFAQCTSLTTANLPASLTSIGKRAFYYCTSLSEFVMPTSLTTLGEYAFSYCTSLSSVTIPAKITSINQEVFSNCTNLKCVTLHSAVTKIGNNAFANCDRLYVVYNYSKLRIVAGQTDNGSIAYNAIKVFTNSNHTVNYYYDGNYYFIGIDGEWYLYDYSTSQETDLRLPDSFEYNGNAISSYTIYKSTFTTHLVSVVIPVSVKAIVSGAFIGVENVYYGGTAADWSKLSANITYGKVYYYSDCVHEEGQWTYINGNIVTAPSSQEETTAATCTQSGVVKRVCSYCNETLSESYLSKLDHTPDENGICSMCGQKVS